MQLVEKKMATHSSILAWKNTVRGVAKSQTWLSDETTTTMQLVTIL